MIKLKKDLINKVVFLGEINSINLEIICNSFEQLKNKVNYYIVGSKYKIEKYLKRINNNNIQINYIKDPINFNLKKNFLNIFDVSYSKSDFDELNIQIRLCNYICNLTGYDLVTMPIDKSVFKKKINFIGITEYLGKLNKVGTFMLMKGENFSIIPITTHVSIDKLGEKINTYSINKFFKKFIPFYNHIINRYSLEKLKFICVNPHCGEEGFLSNRDLNIKNLLADLPIKINGPYPSDSAFMKDTKNCLFFSTYHDQALIPFKLLNKFSCNITIGLKYRRLSPAHGPATDILFQNRSNNLSYIECMTI